MELLDGRRFKLTRDGVDGFLVKKPGFLVFQPAAITDTDIPMTMRYARAFQLARHRMTPSLQVLARSEEVDGVSVKETIPGSGPGSVPGPGPVSGPGQAKVLAEWAEWVSYVDSKGRSALPKRIHHTHKLWSWILRRYADVPEVKAVALRWWFDKTTTYAEKKTLLETAVTDEGDLRQTLAQDIFSNSQMSIYRIFNPDESSIQLFYRGAKGGEYVPCPSNLAKAVSERLGDTPIEYRPEGKAVGDRKTGGLFGFVVSKGGGLVFKTFDVTRPITRSTVGAVCETVSNLEEHHPRVMILHAAGRESELGPLMLPDDDASWTPIPKGFKVKGDEGGPPFHMKDMTQRPLCLYMEFLTRLFDMKRIHGVRWFLSAFEASYSGLKGTVVKK